MCGYTWASSVTTWRVVAKSSREVPRRMKSATNQRCLARWDRESRRRVRYASNEFVTGVATPSNPRFNRARRISHDGQKSRRTNDRAGEGERATLATRLDYHRGRVKNRPWRIVAAWIQTGPTITHVFSMFRRSLVQLAPLVEAENENSSGYSHVIKMDTLRRSYCACAPRDRIGVHNIDCTDALAGISAAIATAIFRWRTTTLR